MPQIHYTFEHGGTGSDDRNSILNWDIQFQNQCEFEWINKCKHSSWWEFSFRECDDSWLGFLHICTCQLFLNNKTELTKKEASKIIVIWSNTIWEKNGIEQWKWMHLYKGYEFERIEKKPHNTTGFCVNSFSYELFYIPFYRFFFLIIFSQLINSVTSKEQDYVPRFLWFLFLLWFFVGLRFLSTIFLWFSFNL